MSVKPAGFMACEVAEKSGKVNEVPGQVAVGVMVGQDWEHELDDQEVNVALLTRVRW